MTFPDPTSIMLQSLRRSPRTPWLFLLLSLLASSCKSSDGGTDQAMKSSPSMEPTLTAPTDDSAVAEHLVQHLKSTRIVGGLREVDLDLENRGDEPARFSYQVEWLDRAGAVVTDMEARWTPMVLASGQRASLSLRAPHPLAESWRLVAVAMESSRSPEDAQALAGE